MKYIAKIKPLKSSDVEIKIDNNIELAFNSNSIFSILLHKDEILAFFNLKAKELIEQHLKKMALMQQKVVKWT